MAKDKEDQKAKDKIKEGMSEAGGDTSNQQAKDRIKEGMSEAGKHPTDPLEDQGGGAPS